MERNRSVAQLKPRNASGTCLLLLHDVDAGLDVGEGVHGGEDGLPLVLLAQLATRPPALGEGRGVHEAPQVEVLLKVGQAVLHLVVVEVGLYEGDLDVRLTRGSSTSWLSVLAFFLLKSFFFIVLTFNSVTTN